MHTMNAHGIRLLKRRDHTLRRIIEQVGPCTLGPRRRYFAALCEAIVSQQLSTKAAQTIYGRFRSRFDRNTPTPAGVLALDTADLRNAGLSRGKVSYVRDLAEKFLDSSIPRRRFAGMDDDAIIEALTQVKGIGVWTAQMFLIFVLNRPDVLPVDDLGLRKAVQQHYGLGALPEAAEFTSLAKPWRPHRTTAVWYLWQSLNNSPVRRKRDKVGT